MHTTSTGRFHRYGVAFLILLLAAPHAGCLGLVANLLHARFGNKVKPRYDGLAGKKVAVICVSRSANFGPTSAAHDIARRMERYLSLNVPEIELIKQQEIDAWIDENGWNQIDYREIGYGLGADALIAVEIKSFSMYEGKTLFKGRCDAELSVHDFLESNGDVVFEEIPPQIQYPITSGQYTADITEEAFRRTFIDVIAYRMARNFYSYDVADDFCRDPTNLGF